MPLLTQSQQDELERIAVDAHARADSDPREPNTSISLARAILGRANVRTVPRTWLPGDGALTKIKGTWQAFVRRDLPPVRLAFAVAHELAEFLIKETELESEPAANYLAAALIAPRPYFRAIARAPDLPSLAREIVASETLVALRWGEVTEQPTLVRTRSFAWERGRPWAWPDRSIEEIPGARRIVFRDQPERRAFLAT